MRLTDEEDFILQINKPYRTGAADVTMNYLTKWSVDTFRIVFLSQGEGLDAQMSESQIAASVLFDCQQYPDRSIDGGRAAGHVVG